MDAGDFRLKAERIRLLVLDVDGVLTDGSICMDERGDERKTFSVRDGFGLRCWTHHGFQAAVITGRVSNAVAFRCREIGIDTVMQGEREKRPAFERTLRTCGVTAEETAVMGDDVPDLPMLRLVGLSAAPADADETVLRRVDWVAKRPGGRGAVREFIEAVLTAKGIWASVIEHYAGTPANQA